MNVKRMSHLDEVRCSLPRAHLGGFLGHGLSVSRWALALCLLGGMLATGCRPTGPVQESPDAGAPADAGTTPPDVLVLARAQIARNRPNLMLLVDTSSSMTSPMNPYSPSCQRNGEVCGGSFDCDPSICPTRWSTLQARMEGFLSRSGTVARIGLATYPGNGFCGPSLALSSELPPEDKDDDATLQLKAQEARDRLLAINNSRNAPLFPQGGTPTGPSLHFLASRPELRSGMRQSFVLLVSDGAPNCNEAYPFPYPDPRCKCVLLGGCSYYPDIGCIDRDNSVEAVRSLRDQGIKTIVIGYGADIGEFSELGRMTVQTFSAMAEAGGFARTCTRDSDCGVSDTCNQGEHWCTRRFYQAGTGSELEAALQGIAERLSQAQCLVAFDAAPSTPLELLTVTLDGQVLAPGADSWALTDEGVLFTGTVCQRLMAATPDRPVSIEVSTAL